jgi:GR25 family glycosyltransferase involved in LPS biosynthesis
MSYNYQYLVISISDKRKEELEKQFSYLNIKEPIHFLQNPATLSNSKDYLPQDGNNETHKVMCCARSHIRALEYACDDKSPEFTIIFEDDVALHKYQFTNAVREIITQWDTLIYPKKMASIGWIPLNNYSKYTNIESPRSLKCIDGSKFLDLFVYGMQAYIVRKRDILPLIKHFVHPTFVEMRDHINSMKFTDLPENYEMIACDGYINKILGQTVVFPPLCIEQVTTSTLGHDNWNPEIWNNFFKNYTSIKSNYYSFV